jgi:hypothetical protein
MGDTFGIWIIEAGQLLHHAHRSRPTIETTSHIGGVMKKILATTMVVGALGLGLGAPVASADPDWGGDCDCGWGWNNGWNGGWDGNWGGPWYPGKWINGCVSGPFGHVSVCW